MDRQQFEHDLAQCKRRFQEFDYQVEITQRGRFNAFLDRHQGATLLLVLACFVLVSMLAAM